MLRSSNGMLEFDVSIGFGVLEEGGWFLRRMVVRREQDYQHTTFVHYWYEQNADVTLLLSQSRSKDYTGWIDLFDNMEEDTPVLFENRGLFHIINP